MPVNERQFFGFRRTRGDASRVDSNSRGVPALLVPTTDRDLHFASVADQGTDWNVANPTHPTLYIHSETTPATDYGSVAHDATDLIITAVGGGIRLVPVGDVQIDNTFGLIIGGATQITISDGDGTTNLIPELQVLGTAAADGSLVVASFNTTNTRAVSPHIALVKGAAATQVATTAVADNEVVGSIIAYGSDSVDFETPVGAIEFVVDDVGAPGAGAIGGSIEFYTTADGGETLTLAMTMNNGQNVLVGSGTSLTISDGDGATNLIPGVQVMGTSAARGTLAVASFNTTNDRTVAPHIALVKGAAATQVATTAVADDEVVGVIIAYGSDSSDFETPVAAIQFVVDDVGAPGAGAIGGSLEFYTTADGGETLTLSFTINNDQNIYVANNNGIVVGATAQRTVNALVPEFQVQGTTVGVDGAMAVLLYSATAGEGPEIILARSKSATLGTNTIVANNDSLGRIVAMGADGGTGFDPAAAIVFEVANTPGVTDDMPGRILFQTSPDASQTPATRMTILSGATTVAQAQLGTAGTSTGALLMAGATSGVVTVTVAAAAGTWTMTLPTGVAGTGGFQLTDAGGDGICSWAAASLGAWKNDLGILDPHEALEAVVSAPTHKFTYNADVMPPGVWDGGGEEFAGVFAEQAPWAMHGERANGNGIAFSYINAFGYARAAIQALYEDFQDALKEIAGLHTQIATLKA